MHLQKQQYHPMDVNNMYHHGSYNISQIPPEPLPSATDIHTAALSISQMAEFSSTMVYLMWHLRNPSTSPLHPSVLHTRPDQSPFTGASSSFRKYCRTILQQTQLSESVVLLSLKYISLLLRNNPQLRGAEGSEYRLFTVALMLANKFLDDNTFTNKTWSDISGMKVKELNVMEFEFLDVLRFALFIPKADFDHWKTTLFNFRNQFYDQNIDPNNRVTHQQQLIETTLKNMGLPFQFQYQQQQHDIQWQQQQQLQQEAARQQQQAAAAAVAAQQQQQQQQYNQHLYLLSKAQQPHIPPQPLNRPLTRVPLRIPVRPVYQTQAIQTSSTPGSHAATVYEPAISGPVANTTATIIQPASTAPPSLTSSQQQHPQPIVQSHNLTAVNNNTSGRRTPTLPSTTDNPYASTSYPPQQNTQHQPHPPPHHHHPHHHQGQPPPRINTNNPQRPYDYARTGSDESSSAHMNLYPQSSVQVITPSAASHNNYYNNSNNSTTNDIYSQSSSTITTSQPHMSGSGGSHRTTSLPSASIDATVIPQPPSQHMAALGNSITSVATAPSLQHVSNNSNNYYNTPPSATLTSTSHFNDHSNYINGTSAYNTNNNNINNPNMTNSQQQHQHNYVSHPHQPSSRAITNNPNNPIKPYYIDHTQQSQPSQVIATPPSAEYTYGTPIATNDPYNRPVVGRASSNPSYQNPYNGQEYPKNTNVYQHDYRTPVPHIQPPPPQHQQQQQPPKKTTGPVPEDPLNAAESYRAHLNRR